MAVIQLPSVWDPWTSDKRMIAHINTWEAIVTQSVDGMWAFYCMACAFCNMHVDVHMSPGNLADKMISIVNVTPGS
jgi:hypothetical protein